MANVQRLLNRLLASPMQQLSVGIPSIGGGSTRYTAASGLRAIGAVASGAYGKFKREDAPSEPDAVPERDVAAAEPAPRSEPPEGEFVPADERAREELGLTLVRAMIAAARADGEFDPHEKKVIYSAVQEHELSKEEQAILQTELKQPVSIQSLVDAAKTRAIATEIYVASLMAIEVDTPEERAWLDKLAKLLWLDRKLVARIHDELGVK